jgi:tRNA threonylcarbamoyl adenosine modification protein YjeE
MTEAIATLELDEAGLARLAEHLARLARPGDVLALEGELGAGKTTFARAFVRALLDDAEAEVTSPTFSLLATYTTPRGEVAHFDLYRLNEAAEAHETGLAWALDEAITLVEWPERAEALLPADRLRIVIADGAGEETRHVTLTCEQPAGRGDGTLAERAARAVAAMRFVEADSTWREATVRHLQGDASARSYARLAIGHATAVLMDAPRRPDGPPVRDGKPYSRIAHLAEDMRPFVAVGDALRRAGFSAPAVLAADLEAGFLLLEDLGDRVFGREMREGTAQAELWRAAVDVLVALRTRLPAPADLPLPDGTTWTLPRFDRAALEIELDLLLDWYWPEVTGGPAPAALRAEMHALWSPILDRLLALPPGWFLRDYHSPNLLWLPERAGVARVGLLDYQDALAEPWAYDLVSLLHDARVDVPRALERELYEYYCREVGAREPGFDRAAHDFAYHAFGAQRRTRHIGLFVRLLRRDGKPQYLQHVPRAWEHLAWCLEHPDLAPLADWYARAFPSARRSLGA